MKQHRIPGLILSFIIVLQAGLVIAASHPQVELVKRLMPGVVGIGIDKAEFTSMRFSGSEFMEEFKKFYQKEEKEFKEKSKPQWDKKKDKVTPEDIRGIGSGFIIDRKGIVVTNYHVVEGQRRVFVTTNDNKVYRAKVLIESPEEDLAILEIDSPTKEFPHLKLGDSDTIEVAEPVIAIGNPFGFSFTVTSGIISAVGRTTPDGKGDMIQTDAAVNPGNSGGPLINMQGEVVGINTMIYTTRAGGFIGVAFAVPVNKAKALLASAPKEKSNVYLGIRLSTTEKGVLIETVESGSPADIAGLKPGETILSVDGRDLKSANDFVKYIRTRKPGDRISLKIMRKDRVAQVAVTLDKGKE
jgi:serine protease Do